MQISSKFLWDSIRFVITTVALFAVWLIFSSEFTLFWILFGIIISLVLSIFTFNVFINFHEAARNSVIPRPVELLFAYIFLIYSMYVSSLKVLYAIFTHSVNPGVVYVKTRLSSDIGRTALANAITFTPGTVVLDLDEDHITVHWLFVSSRHSKAAGDEIKSSMENILKKVWQ